MSRTIAVSPALFVEMLQSVADRWRCSEMVWESKIPWMLPIKLLVEPGEKMLSYKFSNIRRTRFDQSSPVQLVSDPRGGSTNLAEDKQRISLCLI